MRQILIGAAALLLSVAFSVHSALGPPARQAGLVLVVVPPWGADAVRLVHDSGGHPVGPASAPFALLARFDQAPPRAALRARGAWAVRDGRALAAICGVST